MDNSQKPAYPVKRFENKTPYLEQGLTKLEIYTMAAMQGLCVVFGKNVATGDYAQLLAKDAVDIAKATLSELSKHQ
jgi:hypothetical protein